VCVQRRTENTEGNVKSERVVDCTEAGGLVWFSVFVLCLLWFV